MTRLKSRFFLVKKKGSNPWLNAWDILICLEIIKASTGEFTGFSSEIGKTWFSWQSIHPFILPAIRFAKKIETLAKSL